MKKNIKRVIAFALMTFIMVACGTSGDAKDPVSIADALAKNDFTVLEGQYANPAGEIISLNKDGLRADLDEEFFEDVSFDKVYGYSRPTRQKRYMTGYLMFVFPEGMKMPGLDTDKSKVRIAYGHELPLSEADVYSKK